MRRFFLFSLVITILIGRAVWPAPAAADDPCESVVWDWETEDFTPPAYVLEGSGAGSWSLSHNGSALLLNQSGSGLSGVWLWLTLPEPVTIGSGEVALLDSALVGGQVSGTSYLLFSDGTWGPAYWYSGTMAAYARQTKTMDISAYSGKTLIRLGMFNKDSQSGSRDLYFYKFWLTGTGYCPDPTPTPTPEPTPTVIPESCALVPNGGFATAAGWNLLNHSNLPPAIDASAATLGPGDSVYRNLDLQRNVPYKITVKTSAGDGDQLTARLGESSSALLSLAGPGEYEGALVSPNLPAPVFSLVNSSANSEPVSIDFACLELDTDGTGLHACIAPPNGDFEVNDAGWEFHRGADWSSTDRAALLPYNGAGNSAYIYSALPVLLPNISAEEFLIYKYSARASGETGIAMAGAWNLDKTNSFESFVEVSPTIYDFEFDISQLAGEETVIGAANLGFDPLTGTELTGDLVIDNVCVYVSDSPPGEPVINDPNQLYPPVELGEFYNCSDVDSIFYSLAGVDLRYHRLNYDTTPSLWDPSGWVPWLISAMWVMLNVFFCAFLVMWQTIINLVEYAINNGLNIFEWARRIWDQLPGWSYSWLAWFYQSYLNIFTWSYQTAVNWLGWLADTAVEFAGAVPALAEWISANAWNLGIAFFNFLGTVYLYLLVALSGPFGQIVNLIITVWNFFAVFADLVLQLLGYDSVAEALGETVMASAAAISAVFEWLFALIKDLSAAPLRFYQAAMAGLQSDSFGLLIGCSGQTSFWCSFLAGLDLINAVAGHSIFYPIVIVAIVIGTIVILRDNMVGLWEFVSEDIFKI